MKSPRTARVLEIRKDTFLRSLYVVLLFPGIFLKTSVFLPSVDPTFLQPPSLLLRWAAIGVSVCVLL